DHGIAEAAPFEILAGRAQLAASLYGRSCRAAPVLDRIVAKPGREPRVEREHAILAAGRARDGRAARDAARGESIVPKEGSRAAVTGERARLEDRKRRARRERVEPVRGG